MTDEEYQKRLQFIKYVKKNFVPKNGEVLIFYSENYEIRSIRSEARRNTQSLGDYHISRYSNENGSVIFGYDFDNEIIFSFKDKYLEVHENLTQGFVISNRLIEPINIEELKAEITEVIQLLKSQ